MPNAVKHNPPASVNVIKSSARSFELLPECSLKDKAYEALKAACYGVSDAMGMAFDKAFALPKDKAKSLAKPLPSGIQKAVSSKQILNPSLNAGAMKNLNGDELPSPAMPRYRTVLMNRSGNSAWQIAGFPPETSDSAPHRGVSPCLNQITF